MAGDPIAAERPIFNRWVVISQVGNDFHWSYGDTLEGALIGWRNVGGTMIDAAMTVVHAWSESPFGHATSLDECNNGTPQVWIDADANIHCSNCVISQTRMKSAKGGAFGEI